MARGRDAKSYYNTGATWSSPTWVEITGIIDETITPSADLATGGSRAEEYEDNEIASRKFEWNCTYRYKTGTDSVYAALLAAYVAGTPLYMAFLDGSASVDGSKGWKVPILIDQMPQTKNLGDLAECTVHGVGKLATNNSVLYKAASFTVSGSPPTTTTPGPTTTTTPGT
jgi:hypothetical protein